MRQHSLLKDASDAFIVKINDAIKETLTHRYQVYVLKLTDNQPLFTVLYPKEKGDRIKFQVEVSKSMKLPLFHFAIKGKDFQNVRKIAEELKK